jgi:TonB family protein
MSETVGGSGGKAALMIAGAAVLLAAIGWGVDAVVRRIEEELPKPAPPRAARPAPIARPPAPVPRPPTPQPADDARRLREEIDQARANLERKLSEAEAVRPGGDVRPPVAIQSPPPKYTEAARRARIQGVVIVEANVDREGRVTSTRVLKGLPMGLDEAAREAVSSWRFEPATRHGEAVPVIITLTVNFELE